MGKIRDLDTNWWKSSHVWYRCCWSKHKVWVRAPRERNQTCFVYSSPAEAWRNATSADSESPQGTLCGPPSCLSWSCSFKKRRGFTIIIITINSCRFLERRQSSNSEVFSDPSASPVTLSHSPKCLDCLLSACYWCPSQDMGHSLSPVALFKLGDSQLTEDRNGV